MTVKLKEVGSHCLLLQWEEIIPEQIQAVQAFITDQFDQEVLEMVPAYRELAIYLHFQAEIKAVKAALEEHLHDIEFQAKEDTEQVYRIPVCYSQAYGLDLEDLAAEKKMTIEEVIERHTAPTYDIHFLGFLPGFPYLGGLDEKLHRPRLKSPRPRIPAGSVGIAGSQTGIYPQSSPGGWNLIGRTPIKLFDIEKNPPALLKPLQKLKFYEISEEEFEEKEEKLKS